MEVSSQTDLELRNRLLEEIEELERKIEDIAKRILLILSGMRSFNHWERKRKSLEEIRGQFNDRENR